MDVAVKADRIVTDKFPYYIGVARLPDPDTGWISEWCSVTARWPGAIHHTCDLHDEIFLVEYDNG